MPDVNDKWLCSECLMWGCVKDDVFYLLAPKIEKSRKVHFLSFTNIISYPKALISFRCQLNYRGMVIMVQKTLLNVIKCLWRMCIMFGFCVICISCAQHSLLKFPVKMQLSYLLAANWWSGGSVVFIRPQIYPVMANSFKRYVCVVNEALYLHTDYNYNIQ